MPSLSWKLLFCLDCFTFSHLFVYSQNRSHTCPIERLPKPCHSLSMKISNDFQCHSENKAAVFKNLRRSVPLDILSYSFPTDKIFRNKVAQPLILLSFCYPIGHLDWHLGPSLTKTHYFSMEFLLPAPHPQPHQISTAN